MDPRMTHFSEELNKLSISMSDEQYQQFMTYYEMLIEKNKVMNLTAITDFDEVIEKHFVDSLNLVRAADLNKPVKILDMGTGAGFPGIPLKIAFPEIQITLADSLNKRILFLNEVIEALHLKNVEAVHGRAEEMARNKNYREKYDLCVSRAVANLSTLSEYCLPFVKTGGRFIPYKSGECEEETKNAQHAIQVLGGKLDHIEKFMLGDAGRSLIVIDKVHSTSARYPRKAGTPSKEPL